ncbi:MAG TPA: hypothetical protein VM425_19425 [Myxococcota bacterium]|nr:hypothetical protein [Myxococcota bacterium]
MKIPTARLLALTALVLAAWPMQVRARRAKTIAFIPDASCRASKLVTVIEQALGEKLQVKGLEIVQQDKGSANVLLHYFMIQRRQDDKMSIELDGRAFGNQSGKLLAEAAATSDSFPNDEGGHTAAARQAAGQLAADLSASLEKALWARGKGRRIMLQVSLDEKAAGHRDEIVKRLEKALSGMSMKLKGSTERNLVLVFESSERTKDLVESLGRVLVSGGADKVVWLMQSENTLLASIGGS